MCSLSSMGVLLQFGFCVMVGFGGQALTVAERLNWIPPTQRYELALVTALAQLRPEDCELSFIPSSTGESDHTQSELKEDLSDVVEDADWQVRRGLYLSLTITCIPCLCSVAPKGLAPFTRLNNNSMALTAVANTSRSEFIKHLKRFSSSNNPVSSLARDGAVRPSFACWKSCPC
ncbi:ceramide kinase-like protein isoform X1 [Tachysurus ichikawai]